MKSERDVMWKCINCGQDNTDDAKYCKECGCAKFDDFVKGRTLSKVSDSRKRNIIEKKSIISKDSNIPLQKGKDKDALLDEIYFKAVSAMINADSESKYKDAAELFEMIPKYKDARVKQEQCNKLAEDFLVEEERRIASEKAARKLKVIIIMAAAALVIVAAVVLAITVIKPATAYNNAKSLFDNGKYEEAMEVFEALNGYSDSEEQIERCKTAIKDVAYENEVPAEIQTEAAPAEASAEEAATEKTKTEDSKVGGGYYVESTYMTLRPGVTGYINISADNAYGEINWSSSGCVTANGEAWLDNGTGTIAVKANQVGTGYITVAPIDFTTYDGKQIDYSYIIQIDVVDEDDADIDNNNTGETLNTFNFSQKNIDEAIVKTNEMASDIADNPLHGNNETESEVTTEETSTETSVTQYSFVYNGITISMKDDAAPILEALGDPISYEETNVGGLVKYYTYSSFVLSTHPDGEIDRVNSLELLDDTVSTLEGIRIGDSSEKVEKIYSDDPIYAKNESIVGEYAYNMVSEDDNTVLTIFIEDDKVSSIMYLAVF